LEISEKELATQAKKVIEKILYITIASVNSKGEPWNSPVYSAFDENYNFYWVSWTENQHSKNLAENPNAFVVIYDSTVPEGTGFGVYVKGKVQQLKENNLEINKAIKLLYERKNNKPNRPEEFLGKFPRRIFKLTPEEIWVNSSRNLSVSPIDVRIDITKELLK